MKFKIMKELLLLVLLGAISACSNLEPKIKGLENNINTQVQKHQQQVEEQVPVVSSTSAAWLAGTPVDIGEPVLPVLNREFSWHPTKSVSLADAAAYIYQNTGLVVDIAELQNTSSVNGMGMAGVPVGGMIPNMGNVGAPIPPGTPFGQQGYGAMYPQQQSMYSMYINYQGKLSGFLDLLANKTSSWWKIADGRAILYRTESKTFYLPLIARDFNSSSSITTSAGNGASGGTGGATSTVSTGISSAGGVTSTSTYDLKMWASMEATAKVVAAGGNVVANPSAGSITVTGTPSQVRNVETWVNSISDQLSQQVAITVQVFSVKVTREDNYNWNPNIIFKGKSGVLGFNISGPQSPPVISGSTPFNMAVNVVSNASSGNNSQYTGSQLAFQALSTLGKVVEQVSQTVVTMNNQAAPVQIANQKGYVQSSSTTTTANVGVTTSLVPGVLTTGFTAMFLPKIINGKVILAMTMTNSTDNGFTTVSSNGSIQQNPNVDGSTFQQSVSLTPGEALMLTGLQRDSGRISKSGVGAEDNYLFGGGLDNQLGKQIVAIVISARIL